MDIKQTIEKHGLEFFHELLDIALITDMKMKNEFWYDFALRHGLIKKSTKIIRDYTEKSEDHWYYKDGTYRRWDKPIFKYRFLLKNGRGEDVLRVLFTHIQLEEWQNESNPNQAELNES